MTDTTQVISVDARTLEAIETVATSTSAEGVAKVCAEAAEAADRLQALLPAERGAFLRAVAAALEEHRAGLVALADRESALGTARMDGELTRTTNQLRHFADVLEDGHCFEVVIDHADSSVTPPKPDLRRMLVPLGVVAVFGASNFPFAFSAAGGDTASALAAGNAVVVKAHSGHPRLDLEVVHLLRSAADSAGLPADTVGIVFGRQAGVHLVNHPDVKAVGFTGSETAGRQFMDIAAARPVPIPVYAEMGSLNPLIVSAASAADDPQPLAEGIAASVTLGHGQFCTKPGLIFVPRGSDGDRLVAELSRAMSTAQEQSMLTAGIRQSYLDHVAEVLGHPDFTRLVVGGAGAGTGTAPTLVEVDAGDLDANHVALDECFGPYSVVVRYDGVEAVLAASSVVPPSLTYTLHARPEESELIHAITSAVQQRCGRLVFGGFPTGVAVTWSQTHAGPYPASAGLFTSVGASAIRRFLRPVSYQDWPDHALPPHLQEANPLALPRRVDGQLREADSFS